MNKRLYQLYYKKDKSIIEVKPASKKFYNIKMEIKNQDEILNYNDCYKFSYNRKKLKKIGEEYKEKWIEEYQGKINKLLK